MASACILFLNLFSDAEVHCSNPAGAASCAPAASILIVRPSTSKVRGPQTGSVRVSELARVPFLLYPVGTVLRVLIDRFFNDIGVNPHVVMEAEDTGIIKRLVESGFGYSKLPEHALRRRTRFFQTFRVDGHPITRSLALAMVQTDYPRKLTVSIAESLRTMLTA